MSRLQSFLDRIPPPITPAERVARRIFLVLACTHLVLSLNLIVIVLVMMANAHEPWLADIAPLAKGLLYGFFLCGVNLPIVVIPYMVIRRCARRTLESSDGCICPDCLRPFVESSEVSTCTACGRRLHVEDVRRRWARAYGIESMGS